MAVLPQARAADGDLAVGAFSRAAPGAALPADWTPLTFPRIDRHTRYALVADPAAGTVVRADADASASGLVRKLDAPAAERPLLRWSWKVDKAIERGDVTRKEGDDYPARIYVSFRYAPERLSLIERAKYAAARVLYGEYPPHAGLNYIWDAKAAVGTTVPNPFTDRVRMIVVERGKSNLGQWRSYERDIVADYQRGIRRGPAADRRRRADDRRRQHRRFGDRVLRRHHAGAAALKALPPGSRRRARHRRPSFSFATATLATALRGTAFFTAVISARIDTAISGGVRLPM